MSQLFQVATRTGPVVTSTGSLAPDYFDQGLPYDAGGGLAIHSGGAIDHYHQGIPFTVVGRISAALPGTVTRISPGGVPFTVEGFVAFGGAGVDHYSAGIPYTASNQIKKQ